MRSLRAGRRALDCPIERSSANASLQQGARNMVASMHGIDLQLLCGIERPVFASRRLSVSERRLGCRGQSSLPQEVEES